MLARNATFWLLLILVELACAWPYLATLGYAPMTTDSTEWIVRGASTSPDWARWVFAGDHYTWYRPVTALSFTLNHLMAGANAIGYRAVDLALFGLAGALVAALFRALVKGAPRFAPILAAAVWMALPGADELVPYLARRSYTLSTIFGLGGLLLLCRSAPSLPRLCAAGALLALGVLSNEFALVTAAVAPLFALHFAAPGPGRARAALVPAVFAAGAFALRTAVLGGLGGYDLDTSRVDRLREVAAPMGAALFSLGAPLAAVAAGLLAVRAGLVPATRLRDRDERALALLFLWLVLVAALCLFSGVWKARQVIPLELPFALLTTALLFRALAARTRAARAAGLALALAVLAAPLFASPVLRGQDARRRAGWERRNALIARMTSHLAELEGPATVVLALPNLRTGLAVAPVAGGVQLQSAVLQPVRWTSFALSNREVELRDLVYHAAEDARAGPRLGGAGRVVLGPGVPYHVRSGAAFEARGPEGPRAVRIDPRLWPQRGGAYVYLDSGETAELHRVAVSPQSPPR